MHQQLDENEYLPNEQEVLKKMVRIGKFSI